MLKLSENSNDFQSERDKLFLDLDIMLTGCDRSSDLKNEMGTQHELRMFEGGPEPLVQSDFSVPQQILSWFRLRRTVCESK